MLTDGRVAFIDFGIVGGIPRKTADAMLDFVRAYPQGDMPAVAAAISDMGFTAEGVDNEAFARDLTEVIASIESMPAGQIAAGMVDETQLNRAVAAVGKVASGYGIRFPREFALLIKQVLYFDRYTSILAPGLDVMNDERLAMNQPPPSAAAAAAVALGGQGPVAEETAAEPMSVVVSAEVLPPE